MANLTIYLDQLKAAAERGHLAETAVENIERWLTDETGRPIIGRGKTDGGKDRMKIFDPQTEDWRDHENYPALGPDTPIFRIIKEGKELIIGDCKGRDTLGLYIYDLEQKTITQSIFHNDEYDASGVVISSDGETVIGAKYVAEQAQTVINMWLRECNHIRPHQSLNMRPPVPVALNQTGT